MADIYCEFDKTALNEAKKKLSQLSDFEKSAVIAQGLKEGAQIIAKQTKENIDQRLEEHTGNLIGSVKAVTNKKGKKSYVGFQRDDGNIAHVLEKGSAVRKTRSGANRGKVKAFKFEEDAVNSKGQKALDTVAESIEKSIKTIMDRN